MFAKVGKSIAISLVVVVLVALGISANVHSKAQSEPEAISGIVLPSSSISSLTAQSGDSKYSTETDENGSFTFESVPEGTYSVHIFSDDETLSDTTITGVVVNSGKTTDLGTIRLAGRHE